MKTFRWIMLAVVKPLVALFIIVQGVPPTVKAIGNACVAVVKAVKATSK